MRRILIVEDDITSQNILGFKFKTSGFDVKISSTGRQALKELRHFNPEIIVLDIMLPGKMNGMDVLKKLRTGKKYKNIPVLVLTNYGNKNEAIKDEATSGYFIKANTSLNSVVEKVKSLLNSNSD